MSRSRAEIGRLIGYQDVQGTTARIMLEDGRVIHNRNVTYDITDRVSKVTSLTEPPTHEEANSRNSILTLEIHLSWSRRNAC